MQIQIQEKEGRAIGFFLKELRVLWQSHLLWGFEPLHLKSLLLCCVLQKPGTGIAKSLPHLMVNRLGRAAEPLWRWKKRDKAGDGGREGRGKGEKVIKARRSFFPPPLCVLLTVVEAG